MVSPQITAPAGQYGLPIGAGHQEVEIVRNTSGGALAAGDCVILKIPADTADVLEVTTVAGADDELVFGFLAEAIADDGYGQCVTRGIVRDANVADAVAAGGLVATSATAGRAGAATGTAPATIIGVALTDGSAANQADVYVFKA
jgi:hypothetical protein